MPYITAEYYNNEFHGEEIESDELARLIDAASEAIDFAAVNPIITVTENVKRATAYEVECLHEQGGLSALHGFSAAGSAGGTERLGDYSVGGGKTSTSDGAAFILVHGIPISQLAINLLRKDGLMRRCLYNGQGGCRE